MLASASSSSMLLSDDDLLADRRGRGERETRYGGLRRGDGSSGQLHRIRIGSRLNFVPASVSTALKRSWLVVAQARRAIRSNGTRQHHPTLAIDVDSVMRGNTTAADLVTFVLANDGKAPLVFSSGTPEEVSRLQGRYGRDAIAETLDALFADTARKLVSAGVRRLVVAGGETSGAVVSALDLGALTIGPEIDPGVPVVISTGQASVAMALKSGNFGAPDFFVKALDRMAGR